VFGRELLLLPRKVRGKVTLERYLLQQDKQRSLDVVSILIKDPGQGLTEERVVVVQGVDLVLTGRAQRNAGDLVIATSMGGVSLKDRE